MLKGFGARDSRVEKQQRKMSWHTPERCMCRIGLLLHMTRFSPKLCTSLPAWQHAPTQMVLQHGSVTSSHTLHHEPQQWHCVPPTLLSIMICLNCSPLSHSTVTKAPSFWTKESSILGSRTGLASATAIPASALLACKRIRLVLRHRASLHPGSCPRRVALHCRVVCMLSGGIKRSRAV